MNKTFNEKKYCLHDNRWIRTTVPQVKLSHDVWNYYNPNNLVKKEEDIHHINGDTTDDRIENLEKMTHGAHSSLHHTRESNPMWKGGIKTKALYLGLGTIEKNVYYDISIHVNSLGEVGSSYFGLKDRRK